MVARDSGVVLVLDMLGGAQKAAGGHGEEQRELGQTLFPVRSWNAERAWLRRQQGSVLFIQSARSVEDLEAIVNDDEIAFSVVGIAVRAADVENMPRLIARTRRAGIKVYVTCLSSGRIAATGAPWRWRVSMPCVRSTCKLRVLMSVSFRPPCLTWSTSA